MIEAMDLVKVDITGAEPAQTLIDLEQDIFAGQTRAIRAGAHPVEDLGGDDHFLASREIIERSAENLLALANRVAVGGIEEIDAGFKRLPDERTALFLAKRCGCLGRFGAGELLVGPVAIALQDAA